MTTARKLKAAADIGGTFTDITLMLEDGSIATEKVASTPDDYSRGIIVGLTALLDSLGLSTRDVGEVLHGCTVATNTILEGRGARTGLITTRGFRDVLELRRIRVPRLYDPLYVKPEPLAPRELRMEVTERIAADGSVVVPLDEADVARAIEDLRRMKVEAIAVCCLHSYLNPRHEQRIGEMVRAALPGVFLTLSCEILPEIREYERTSTAVINSYVGPPVASYIQALDGSLRRSGITGRLLVMQSTGGILDAASVMRMPARIVECGPAAGVIGAAFQAASSGYRDVITFDMGGTTAKAAMIEGGQVMRTDEYEVGGGISLSSRLVKGGGYALKLPVIDISEVGAGGGSLVWFDRAGALQVGPRSAGAVMALMSVHLGSRPLMSVTTLGGASLRSRAAMVSPRPNSPMATTAKSSPSPRDGTPKVKRWTPVFTSVPTMPSSMPTRIMPMALTTEPCARITAAIRPNTIREKYSAAPNCCAIDASGGPTRAIPTVATLPAKNDPIAAIANAAPARP